MNEINLLFTNKTRGSEEDSWWETFESKYVASIMSFSLTHTDSEDTHCLWGHTLSLRTHTDSEDTHWLTDSEDTNCLWGHTLTLRTHTDSLTLRTHTVSEDTHWLWGHTLTLRTHWLTDSEDTHCLWGHTLTHWLRTHTVCTDSKDTHCLTDSEDTHCLTDSEDTHCGGNLWHHYSIKTLGPFFQEAECIWCFGDRMSLERLRCTGWVRDQLPLSFPLRRVCTTQQCRVTLVSGRSFNTGWSPT